MVKKFFWDYDFLTDQISSTSLLECFTVSGQKINALMIYFFQRVESVSTVQPHPRLCGDEMAMVTISAMPVVFTTK